MRRGVGEEREEEAEESGLRRKGRRKRRMEAEDEEEEEEKMGWGEPLNDVSTFSQRGPLLKIERLMNQCHSLSTPHGTLKQTHGGKKSNTILDTFCC